MSETPSSNRKVALPVVVLGFPRSGTTLLSKLLDKHPEISSPPETNMLAACGRFLRETDGEGPPLGVLSGLALSGIEEDVILDELRRMVFSIQTRLANGKPVWMEKSAFDIFYLDEIERLLAGHCRFVCPVRNPLDVIVSVRELVDKAGHHMVELRDYIVRYDSPYLAYAQAWIDCAAALERFVARHKEHCLIYRYEDLVERPEETLAKLTSFIGVSPPAADLVASSFSQGGRIGLGDWKIYERKAIDQQSIGRWRQSLPKSIAAKIIPQLAPYLTAYGYPVPNVPRVPGRMDKVRQFELAKRMQMSAKAQSESQSEPQLKQKT